MSSRDDKQALARDKETCLQVYLEVCLSPIHKELHLQAD
jgi:hypothetical protein